MGENERKRKKNSPETEDEERSLNFHTHGEKAEPRRSVLYSHFSLLRRAKEEENKNIYGCVGEREH